ncbi:hypothetical protein KAX75_08620 [candidate division WOR-3 bacterium]|nr:hypothetical protein [candidate division WOR-3 bacterium]
MKELLRELSKNDIVLGSFFFKGTENLFSFTEKYSVPESRIKRIALVLTQTMDALGGIAFDRFLLEGEDKRISIYKYNGGYCGIIFKNDIDYDSIESIYHKLISKVPPVEEEVKVKPTPEITEKEKLKIPEKEVIEEPEKEETVLPPSIFEKMSEILTEYLGDFSETIFTNQMSDMKIKPEFATFSELQSLCFSLQKASAMLIGPSHAREMVDKLIALIKS